MTAELELVHGAKRGDRAAFGRLFERYAPMIHGLLLSRVRTHEVDDLVQDVFVAALEKIDSLRDEATVGAWLASIARNRATDLHRRRREESDATAVAVAERASATTEAERVLALIRTLPEAYRETLVLRLVEGMTGPEIARQVGLTPESVRVNLHRGMKLLKDKLGEP